MKYQSCVVFGFAIMSMHCQAVVIASGGPNNAAPMGQNFFNNVGVVGSATGIYLGNGWVLTANHVAPVLPASATFGGVSYPTDPGTWTRLNNPSPFSTFTDIVLFRLTSPPALPPLTLRSSTPTVGTDVVMIGNGRIQNPETFWNSTTNPWTVTTEALSDKSGYRTANSKEIRWGENEVYNNFIVVNMGTILSPVHVLSFNTQFDKMGMTQEAQAVAGDSGGGVFTYNGSSWDLAGMMFAVSTFTNQPNGGETAVYGNQTYIADLSVYRSQILSIIPEPSSALLIGLATMLVFIRRR